MVVLAGEGGEPGSRKALDSLCRDYWRPLYHFARRSGFEAEDAQDLTQGFILDLLQRNSLATADRGKGRFRTFLLGSFSNFLMNHRRDATALKRGGGREIFSIDAGNMEAAFALEERRELTPELQYDRSWAKALLEKVQERLKAEYEKAGRAELFAALQPLLSGGEKRPGYARLGEQLGLSENALTVAVHRLRKRYGQYLREEIAGTVASPDEVDAELQYLIRVFSANG
jgi:RNA polymerase sigma-70 factor (ECF subfamily)